MRMHVFGDKREVWRYLVQETGVTFIWRDRVSILQRHYEIMLVILIFILGIEAQVPVSLCS